MRVSTLVLIVAFLALFWVYHNFEPEPATRQPTPAVVPPGFVPDPNYTWVPRTNVRRPKEPTTTTTTTSPTETTTTSPGETTSPPSPTETPTTTVIDPDGPGPLTGLTVTPPPPLTPPTTTPAVPGPSPTTPVAPE
jgi:hypothetical protein